MEIDAPHTSFNQRNIRVGAPVRQSIEVRALVFTEKHVGA